MRHIFVISIFMVLTSPAFAGFEWVPPAQQPVPAQARQKVPSVPVAPISLKDIPLQKIEMVPVVEAAPAQKITPQPVVNYEAPKPQAPIATKALSHQLMINPYPLRDNVASASKNAIGVAEVYKAMNEASGKLNPVQLGNGMKTNSF